MERVVLEQDKQVKKEFDSFSGILPLLSVEQAKDGKERKAIKTANFWRTKDALMRRDIVNRMAWQIFDSFRELKNGNSSTLELSNEMKEAYKALLEKMGIIIVQSKDEEQFSKVQISIEDVDKLCGVQGEILTYCFLISFPPHEIMTEIRRREYYIKATLSLRKISNSCFVELPSEFNKTNYWHAFGTRMVSKLMGCYHRIDQYKSGKVEVVFKPIQHEYLNQFSEYDVNKIFEQVNICNPKYWES